MDFYIGQSSFPHSPRFWRTTAGGSRKSGRVHARATGAQGTDGVVWGKESHRAATDSQLAMAVTMTLRFQLMMPQLREAKRARWIQYLVADSAAEP